MKKIYMIIIIIILSICLTSCDNYSIESLKGYGNIKILDYKNEVSEEEFVLKINQYLDLYYIDRYTRDYVYKYAYESEKTRMNVSMEVKSETQYTEEFTRFDYDNLTAIVASSFGAKQLQSFSNDWYYIDINDNYILSAYYDSIYEEHYLKKTDIIYEVKDTLDKYLNLEYLKITNSFYIDDSVFTFSQICLDSLNNDYIKDDHYRIIQIVFNEKKIDLYFKEFYYQDYGRELVAAIPEFAFPETGVKGYYASYKYISFENVDIPLVDIESLLNNSKQ